MSMRSCFSRGEKLSAEPTDEGMQPALRRAQPLTRLGALRRVRPLPLEEGRHTALFSMHQPARCNI